MNSALLTKTRLAPTLVAPDTYVIHDHAGEGTAPVAVPLNTMVIRGREPVVIDTGMMENRTQYLEDLFSIVEPHDIRWIVISHDDVDHTGNVNTLMELAPNARLVVSWFMWERMGASLAVAPHRQRWLNAGDRLDVGDRTLALVRPPVYDSPTTRGVFDPTTGVYWGADAFASPMLTPTPDVDELPSEFWGQGFAMFAHYVSPWTLMADDAKFEATVRTVESLGVTTITGCHTPVIGAHRVADAFGLMRSFRSAVVPPEPDQSTLDQIVAAISAAVH